MTYGMEEFLQARRLFRGRLGLPPERFDDTEILSMLTDELQKAQARGLSPQDMAELLHQAGIDITAEDIEQHRK